MVETLTSLATSVALKYILSQYDDDKIEELRVSSYKTRILIFEEITYYPLAILLAHKYTMDVEYGHFFSNLSPFGLYSLSKDENNDKYKALFKETNNLELIKLHNSIHFSDQNIQDYILTIMIFLYRSMYNRDDRPFYKSARFIEIAKEKVMVNELDSFPVFRRKTFQYLSDYMETHICDTSYIGCYLYSVFNLGFDP